MKKKGLLTKIMSVFRGNNSDFHMYAQEEDSSNPDIRNFDNLKRMQNEDIDGRPEEVADIVLGVSGGAVQVGDLRIEKKPVEVVSEIATTQPEMSLNNIDDQIKIVEKRLKVLTKLGMPNRDELRCLKYLRSRKLYAKNAAKFKWVITTEELIRDLVNKYKVQRVSFANWTNVVPNDALVQLELFTEAWAKVRIGEDATDKPTFELIVDYKGKEHARNPKPPDPILFASSPFGAWYYVLGAWDKEVEIVGEIIYHRK